MGKKWDIGYGMVYFSATTPNYLWHVGVSENASLNCNIHQVWEGDRGIEL